MGKLVAAVRGYRSKAAMAGANTSEDLEQAITKAEAIEQKTQVADTPRKRRMDCTLGVHRDGQEKKQDK
jgi:hypothetical protein